MDSNLDSILEIEHHMNTNLSVRQKKQDFYRYTVCLLAPAVACKL